MTQGPSREFETASLQRADEALESARVLADLGRTRDAVSRSYYAIFHATRALLARQGVTVRSHRGLRAQFALQVILPGLLDPHYGDILAKAADMRELGDYQVAITLPLDDALAALRDAEDFVSRIREVLGRS